MFCDLVGPTALSARLDPEDLREVVGADHRCCADLITEAGGFVAKYRGDGVLAYFGYPLAHEHDAEHAVRAGLALVEAALKLTTAAGVPLQVRVGIATGLVVVGDLIGAGAAQEQAVVGEMPNLAARLQALAERTLSQALTPQYDKVMFILEPSDQARAAIGKRVTVVGYPDGRLAIPYKGIELAYRTFDKLQQVDQGAIIENKRLGAALAFIREQQLRRAPERRSTKAPRRRDQRDARLFKVG
jgi:hypothetical protein